MQFRVVRLAISPYGLPNIRFKEIPTRKRWAKLLHPRDCLVFPYKLLNRLDTAFPAPYRFPAAALTLRYIRVSLPAVFQNGLAYIFCKCAWRGERCVEIMSKGHFIVRLHIFLNCLDTGFPVPLFSQD